MTKDSIDRIGSGLIHGCDVLAREPVNLHKLWAGFLDSTSHRGVSTPAPDRKGILELLDHGSNLKTPAFQRSFAWGAQQVDEFWSDLKRALDQQSGPAEYFLGLIVLDNADEIQDGQQRLAVTLLLASELYLHVEAAKSLGNHDAQLAVDASALVMPALRQSPSAPLVISVQDQEVLLNRAGIRSDSPESSRRLAAARARIRSSLDADLMGRTSPDARLGRLKQWGAYLRGDAYVVVLRVPPKDAHNIFETLNTRGVRLSNGDLVKSHLISRATDPALAITKWNAVTDALKDAKSNYRGRPRELPPSLLRVALRKNDKGRVLRGISEAGRRHRCAQHTRHADRERQALPRSRSSGRGCLVLVADRGRFSAGGRAAQRAQPLSSSGISCLPSSETSRAPIRPPLAAGSSATRC